MTLLKPICRRYLLRLWLFSIAYQAGLISQSSPTLESFSNDSADTYYDADSMSSEIAYLDDVYLDPSEMKYYDPTTGDFSTHPDSYHPPVLRANIRYYDPITVNRWSNSQYRLSLLTYRNLSRLSNSFINSYKQKPRSKNYLSTPR